MLNLKISGHNGLKCTSASIFCTLIISSFQLLLEFISVKALLRLRVRHFRDLHAVYVSFSINLMY